MVVCNEPFKKVDFLDHKRYKLPFRIFKFCLISNYSNSGGLFRTQSNIYDGALSKNN